MNVPQLRFKEFSDPWRKENIQQLISSIDSGWSPLCEVYPANIEDWGVLKTTSTTWTGYNDAENKKLPAKFLPRPQLEVMSGDILITRAGPVERVGVVSHVDKTRPKLMLSDKLIRIKCNDSNYSIFLAKVLGSREAQAQLESLKSGLAAAQSNISQSGILGLKITIPELAEQTKIAKFLTAVEDRISQLTQKCDLLTKYRKGVMQQIFSQELRFKDMDGREFPEWEEKQADELFVSHSNKNHNGEHPILAATQDKGMIYREDSGLDIKSSEASIKSYKIVEKGDFVISLRSFQGGIEYSNLMGICSPAYTVLKPKIEIVDKFFAAYLKKEDFIERLSSTVVGIRDGKQISFNAFATVKLSYPCIEEQTKIANFLSAIDDKIINSQAHLEAMKKYKQGLVQQMFV